MWAVIDTDLEMRMISQLFSHQSSGTARDRLLVSMSFEQIQQHPTVWRLLNGRFRRYLLQRFPYGIISAVEGKVIYIAAVIHLKRKPGYWVSRGQA